MNENKVGERIKNRVDRGRDMCAAIGTQGKAVAEKLDGVGGRSEADWQAHLDGIEADQQKHDERLMKSELALAAERADDGEFRDARTEGTRALAEKVFETKDFLKDVPTQATFSLDGRTPEDPKSLAAYASAAVFALRKKSVTLPGPLGTSLTSHQIADALEPLVVAVEASVEAVKTETRKADQLLVERNAELETWQEVYVANGQMAEGAFRRAGFKELAERIRPTERKVSGLDTPEETPQPGVPVVDEAPAAEPSAPIEAVEAETLE